jgi:hypothetical protein
LRIETLERLVGSGPLGVYYLGLWPIALAGAIALLLLVAELAAIGVKRVRNRTSE